MQTNTRACRECSERFSPLRYDQAYCRPCSDARRDIDLVEACLFSSPGRTVDWVSIATGVSSDRIRELAAEGKLRKLPAGADLPTECVCEPEKPGRCPYCRSKLALRLHEAHYEASKGKAAPARGMRMRRDGS